MHEEIRNNNVIHDETQPGTIGQTYSADGMDAKSCKAK